MVFSFRGADAVEPGQGSRTQMVIAAARLAPAIRTTSRKSFMECLQCVAELVAVASASPACPCARMALHLPEEQARAAYRAVFRPLAGRGLIGSGQENSPAGNEHQHRQNICRKHHDPSLLNEHSVWYVTKDSIWFCVMDFTSPMRSPSDSFRMYLMGHSANSSPCGQATDNEKIPAMVCSNCSK